MSDRQRFGNEVLTPGQVQSLRHRFKQGESLTNLETEKLLETADFAISELAHILKQESGSGRPSGSSG